MVDLHDVGVLQAGDGLGLGQETGDGLGVRMSAGQNHLQNARAVQEDLLGEVDDPHAAAAELGQDLIAVDNREGPLRASIRRHAVQPRSSRGGRLIAVRLARDRSPGFGSSFVFSVRGRLRPVRGIEPEEEGVRIGRIE